MYRTDQDADRMASHYTETAALITQEYAGRRSDYLAEIARETNEINALPISDNAKTALIAYNAIIHRQVLNSL